MRKGLRALVKKLNVGMDKYLPDALVFAIALTLICFVVGIVVAKKTPIDMIGYWGSGFWAFLAFSMEIALGLVTGFTLATSQVGKKFFNFLAGIPKNSLQAVIFMCLFGAIISFVHWAVGLIACAFMARTIAYRLKKVDFKLLVAVAYLSTMDSTLGLSSPEFLTIATPKNFLFETLGQLYPFSTTTFTPTVMVYLIVTMLIAFPVLFAMIHPSAEETPQLDPKVLERFEAADRAAEEAIRNAPKKSEMTVAEKIDNSPILNYIIGLGGIVWCVWWFGQKGFAGLSLDSFNFVLLMLGVLAHKTPRHLIDAFEEGTKAAAPVLLQFPFYAGIQGMMQQSGLIGIIATAFASISTPDTFLHWNYICNVILNFFVPSSGGLFMVAGPAMAKAGAILSIPGNHTIVAFTAGETLGNMIQPFWALPLLGVAGLKMKDIMGYCIVAFLVASIIFNICLAVFW